MTQSQLDVHEAVQKIEHEWPRKRLLVVGDVMLDKYIWGDVGRISPEAPVPVVRATHQTHQPGGAANVAVNLAKLGASVVLVGFTGGDADESLLVAGLAASNITPLFVVCSGFPTITKMRIVGGRQQMLRLDSENLNEREHADHQRILSKALQELPKCDALVLSDYAKGVLSITVCEQLIAEARRLAIPVLVDPKTKNFARYKGATTICPNLAELSAASGEHAGDVDAMLQAAEQMVTQFDLEYMTATLSEKGIAVVRPGSRFLAPAVARQVFDVSGAGDTVIAVLAICLASGLSIEPAVELANVAAGIVIGKVGTVPVEKHELLAALEPDLALHAQDKVLDREALVRRVAVWRASGEQVAFTNGCFDLLHVGHIAVLEQARRQGDRLIVAINSDASVAALKGPSRPVVNEDARAHVLAALAAVDAVVVFGEATPLDLILAARPDVIVKGGDYDESTIVGAREVKSWGGRVAIVPIVAGHSTTRLIERSINTAVPVE